MKSEPHEEPARLDAAVTGGGRSFAPVAVLEAGGGSTSVEGFTAAPHLWPVKGSPVDRQTVIPSLLTILKSPAPSRLSNAGPEESTPVSQREWPPAKS